MSQQVLQYLIDDSHLEKFVGGYDDWLSQRKQLQQPAKITKNNIEQLKK